MDEITRYIMLNAVDRPVVNRTGLNGYFSLELEFLRGSALPAIPPPEAPAEPAGTSIFTVVREQLGLGLEPTRTPLDLVVIESIDRPTPD